MSELTLSDILMGNIVEFTVRNPMADSDHQTDKRGGQNLREKGEKKEKITYFVRDFDRTIL